LQPLDRIQVIYRPSTYLTFGATHVAETPFNAPVVSLAEAVARAGGPIDERADPNAIFLFRYEQPRLAQALGLPVGLTPVPVIYHLDMMNTDSYFLAQRIRLRNKDVIYVANARTDKFGKFLGLISALFTPAIVARSVQ
jgi:polysaccharide export outer membrane protein